MYKYKCTSKFTMLLFIDGSIVEVRPNQIIETVSKIDYKYIKPVILKKETKKNAK
jgi:hypothetical protein